MHSILIAHRDVAFAEQLATVHLRTAAGYLEGYRATVLGIKANEAVLGISHDSYGHMAVLTPDKRAELAKDLD